MKKIIFGIQLVVVFSMCLLACKKSNVNAFGISNSKLIGTWEERSPCVQGAADCYKLKFTSAYRCYFYSPYVDSFTYNLPDGDSIAFINTPYLTRYPMSMYGDSLLVLGNFYTPSSINLGYTPSVSVTFRKIQ